MAETVSLRGFPAAGLPPEGSHWDQPPLGVQSPGRTSRVAGGCAVPSVGDLGDWPCWGLPSPGARSLQSVHGWGGAGEGVGAGSFHWHIFPQTAVTFLPEEG